MITRRIISSVLGGLFMVSLLSLPACYSIPRAEPQAMAGPSEQKTVANKTEPNSRVMLYKGMGRTR